MLLKRLELMLFLMDAQGKEMIRQASQCALSTPFSFSLLRFRTSAMSFFGMISCLTFMLGSI